jgi:hypothetical protein
MKTKIEKLVKRKKDTVNIKARKRDILRDIARAVRAAVVGSGNNTTYTGAGRIRRSYGYRNLGSTEQTTALL